MEPMRTLYEEPEASAELPPELATAYGGGLALAPDLVYANFVASLDGVVALEDRRSSGTKISGRNPADLFLVGLLRALADAVLVGAGTLEADGGGPWSPARASPAHATAYRQLGRREPRLVVVSGSGELDPAQPALETGALVLTGEAGAARLRGRLPAGCSLQVLGPPPFSGRQIVGTLRAAGFRRVLTEGGPRLLTALLADGSLDELFLTTSPVLVGRAPGRDRLGLLEGLALPAGSLQWARLRSVKLHGSHLFLRYALNR